MKLRRLELEQFRTFDRTVRVDGLADGLNILCGPNESGKSTLLMALEAAFFERHRAGGEQVKQFRPWESRGAPRVAVDFELAGRPYRIEKRFLVKELARLDRPDGAPMLGDEAEEELQRLLDFERPGNRGPSPEQQGTWSLLWVRQGASVAVPEIGPLARRSLEGCLIDEFEAVVGTDESRRIWARIDDAHHQLETRHGRPRGAYAEVLEKLETADAERHELTRRLAHLAVDLQELETARHRLAQTDDCEEDRQLSAERDRARADLERRRGLDDRLSTAIAEKRIAEKELEPLEKDLRWRREIRAKLAAGAPKLAEFRQFADEAATAFAAAEADLGRQRAKRAAFEHEREALGKRLRSARQAESGIRERAELDRLRTQLDRARRDDGEARRLAAEAARIPLDEASVEQIRCEAETLERCRLALAASATEVRIDIEEAGAERVRVAGATVSAGHHLHEIVSPLTVEIVGIGRIAIRPRLAHQDQLHRDRERAQATLARLLDGAGADSALAAEAEFRRKLGLEREAARKRETADLLAAAALHREQADLAQLSDQVLHLEAALAASDPATGGLAEDVDRLEQDAESLDASITTLRRQIEAADQQLTGLRNQAADHRRRHEREEAEAARQQAQLEAAVGALSDAALDGALVDARQALEEQERSVLDLQRQAEEEPLSLMEARLERLERAIESRRSEQNNLRVQISRLEGSIASEEGRGLAEQIAERERHAAALTAQRDGFVRELDSLKILKEALEDAENEATERYLAPVRERLRPYLNWLFDSAEVDLADFRISALRRGDSEARAIEQLSDGTREQIAVLTRIAFAEMLADRGRPAVVILDDALAFSDEDRLQKMFDILKMAAEKVQILVLTCRERAFERLGGTRLRIVSQDDDERAAVA